MAAGNDPLEDQPQQLQEEVARLRADNRPWGAETQMLPMSCGSVPTGRSVP